MMILGDTAASSLGKFLKINCNLRHVIAIIVFFQQLFGETFFKVYFL